jgi:hypothetical protein
VGKNKCLIFLFSAFWVFHLKAVEISHSQKSFWAEGESLVSSIFVIVDIILEDY